jgi:plastocyanin
MRTGRLFCLLVSLGLLAAAPAQATPANVDVVDFSFQPFRVKVQPGEAVTWRIVNGPGHTATSRRGAPAAFSSGTKLAGESYSFKFTVPGRYRYLCLFHPDQMSGVVQVGDDTVDPVVAGVRVRRGRKSVRLSFRVSEEARARASLTRAGKVVKTIRTKVLRQGARSVLIKPRALKPGRYRLRLEVTDLEGNTAKPVSKHLTVPPRKTS